MIYQASDPYGRSRYNPLALRAMVVDKLRERLLGLMFIPEAPLPAGQPPTLDDILAGRVKARLYDAYRQSWVASPEPAYVAAGNTPLRAPWRSSNRCSMHRLQTVDVNGKPVPTVGSGLSDTERQLLQSPRSAERPRQDHAHWSSTRGSSTRRKHSSARNFGTRSMTCPKVKSPSSTFNTPSTWRQLRLPDPQRQLRRCHRRLRAQAAVHERPCDLPDRRLVAMDPRPSPGGDHQRRHSQAAGADRRWRRTGCERRTSQGRDPLHPGLFQKLWDYHNEWTVRVLRRAGPPRRPRAASTAPRRP